MFFLSPTIVSVYGSLCLRDYQVTGDYNSVARISKTKLLDGTTSVIHSGVSDGDRTVTIDCRLTPSEASTIKAWHRAATQLRLSYWDGVYTTYISNPQIKRDGETTIIFDIIERLI